MAVSLCGVMFNKLCVGEISLWDQTTMTARISWRTRRSAERAVQMKRNCCIGILVILFAGSICAQELILVRALHGHAERATALAFDRDGTQLATGDEEGTIRLWDVRSGKNRAKLAGHKGSIASVAFSPSGKTLASSGGEDRTIKLWVATTAQIDSTKLTPVRFPIRVAYRPNGQLLVIGAERKTAYIWHGVRMGNPFVLRGHVRPVQDFVLNPTGEIMATGDDGGTIRLWNSQTGDILATSAADGGTFDCLCFSANGKMLASGDSRASVALWTIPDCKYTKLNSYGDETETVDGLAFGPASELLAIAVAYSGSGRLELYDVTKKEFLVAVPMGEEKSYARASLAFSPDGKLLATGGKDNVVRLWRVNR